ncbi:peptidoglycan-binding protein [Streptomyces sp. GC420]|uniref:peptidoglycan-binding protein n=1 Tax=Streptomyces sp. GC420 TaxID=2697568 RepID=UPI001414F335|nr:peptidoglycan-binding protein [Streptomyces sp. GC420]NBM15715.1 hypothetical protein [Streptomyces sp. GC420]
MTVVDRYGSLRARPYVELPEPAEGGQHVSGGAAPEPVAVPGGESFVQAAPGQGTVGQGTVGQEAVGQEAAGQEAAVRDTVAREAAPEPVPEPAVGERHPDGTPPERFGPPAPGSVPVPGSPPVQAGPFPAGDEALPVQAGPFPAGDEALPVQAGPFPVVRGEVVPVQAGPFPAEGEAPPAAAGHLPVPAGPFPVGGEPFPGSAGAGPWTQDLGLLAHAPEGRGGAGAPGGRAARRQRGKRPVTAVISAGAAVVVIGFGALAAWTLGGTEDDEALPDPEVTESVPAGPTRSAGPSPSATRDEASPSRSASPSASPAAATSAAGVAASPSRAAPAAPEQPSRAPSRRPSPTAASAPVLEVGSRGPEVVELQERLAQIGAYRGRADGEYDARLWTAVARFQGINGITDDPLGAYGPETRRVLESMTREPRQRR